MGGAGALPLLPPLVEHVTISLEDESLQNRGDSPRGVSGTSPGGVFRSGVAPIPSRSTSLRKWSWDSSSNNPWGSAEMLKVGLKLFITCFCIIN